MNVYMELHDKTNFYIFNCLFVSASLRNGCTVLTGLTLASTFILVVLSHHI